MPATPIPKPVLVVTVHVQTLSSSYVNVSYWDPITPPTTFADMNQIAVDFNAAFGALYGSCLGPHSRYRGCATEFLDGTHVLEGQDASPFAGGNPGPDIGDEVAVVIRKETGLQGHQHLGRYFIGGLDASVFDLVDPNEVNALQLNTFQALAAAYGSDKVLNGVNTHARHWNRKDSVLEVVTGCFVSSRLATRRSRRKHSVDYPE